MSRRLAKTVTVAKAKSSCPWCLKDIKPGDNIRLGKRGWRHLKCRNYRHKKGPRPSRHDEYREYIASSAWQVRRDRYLRNVEDSCRVCGAKDQLTIHHLSYRNLGDEPDSDLMALCWEHHQDAHVFHAKHGGSLRHATHNFVKLST